MDILYKDERTREKLQDEVYLNKKYPKQVVLNYLEFRNRVYAVGNLNELIWLSAGMKIKKLSGDMNGYRSARLNDKYRLHFKCSNKSNLIEITSLQIIEIDKHQDY